MIESLIFYVIVAFMGFLLFMATKFKSPKVSAAVIFLLPAAWLVIYAAFSYWSSNEVGIAQVVSDAFNAKTALQAAFSLKRIGTVYIVGSIVWFTSLWQLLSHLTSRSRSLTS